MSLLEQLQQLNYSTKVATIGWMRIKSKGSPPSTTNLYITSIVSLFVNKVSYEYFTDGRDVNVQHSDDHQTICMTSGFGTTAITCFGAFRISTEWKFLSCEWTLGVNYQSKIDIGFLHSETLPLGRQYRNLYGIAIDDVTKTIIEKSIEDNKDDPFGFQHVGSKYKQQYKGIINKPEQIKIVFSKCSLSFTLYDSQQKVINLSFQKIKPGNDYKLLVRLRNIGDRVHIMNFRQF